MSADEYIDILHAEKNNYVQEISKLQRQVADLNEDIMSLKERHADEQAKHKQTFEAEIQQLQRQAFQGIEDNRFQPLDDTSVSASLGKLQSSITTFAKTYALDSLASLKSQPDGLLMELKHLLEDGGVAILASTDSLLELAEMRHSGRLLLTGLLSSAVHTKVFSNPFFFMSDGLQSEFDALPDTYNYLKERVDIADAFHENFRLFEEGL